MRDRRLLLRHAEYKPVCSVAGLKSAQNERRREEWDPQRKREPHHKAWYVVPLEVNSTRIKIEKKRSRHLRVTGFVWRFTVSSLLKNDDIRGLGVFIKLSSGVRLGGVPACMPLESLCCRIAVTACALMVCSREGGEAILTFRATVAGKGCDPASSLNETEGFLCNTRRG